MYVAEVSRRTWSLWHNGLGRVEHLDNRKEPKRDNKADLYVAEVPRRAWSLRHNGLGWAERLDNQEKQKQHQSEYDNEEQQGTFERKVA